MQIVKSLYVGPAESFDLRTGMGLQRWMYPTLARDVFQTVCAAAHWRRMFVVSRVIDLKLQTGQKSRWRVIVS